MVCQRLSQGRICEYKAILYSTLNLQIWFFCLLLWDQQKAQILGRLSTWLLSANLSMVILIKEGGNRKPLWSEPILTIVQKWRIYIINNPPPPSQQNASPYSSKKEHLWKKHKKSQLDFVYLLQWWKRALGKLWKYWMGLWLSISINQHMWPTKFNL